MDTTKGNKLIAEFLNLKQGDAWQVWNGHRDYSEISDLKYHSEWGWVMPVVEHIESLGFISSVVKMAGGGHLAYFLPEYTDDNIGCSDRHESKITAVWLAVVAFIEWYNKREK